MKAFPLASVNSLVLSSTSKESPFKIIPLTAAKLSTNFPILEPLELMTGILMVKLSEAICPRIDYIPLLYEMFGYTLREEVW